MYKLNREKNEPLLFISWAIAVVALFGSLYFSEILQYEPCSLCWYQRIFMYPLVLLLGIAYVRRDNIISLYAMVFAGFGAIISLYQVAIQKIPFFADRAVDCGRVPCTEPHINWLNFISLPFLSFVAFIIIFICCFIVWNKSGGK